jgi:hypothetical protein
VGRVRTLYALNATGILDASIWLHPVEESTPALIIRSALLPVQLMLDSGGGRSYMTGCGVVLGSTFPKAELTKAYCWPPSSSIQSNWRRRESAQFEEDRSLHALADTGLEEQVWTSLSLRGLVLTSLELSA